MKNKVILIHVILLAAALISSAQTAPDSREKVWEAEISAFLEIDAKQTPPEKAVLFTGSSSIRLWKTLRADFPHLKVINRGFGGSRLDDLNLFAPKIVLPYKPKMIVVYSGENDIQDGQPAEDVLADFKAFVEFRDKNLRGVPIVYISLKPSILRWKLWPEMSKANSLIREEAKKHRRVTFADLASKMLGADGKPLPDIFVSDGLHMNEKGYAIWRENLGPVLR
jgi:lysophospholipase L1-like esterase